MTDERNREAWLTDFLLLSLPYIKEKTGLAIDPRRVKLSCGFPSKGGRARKNRTVGECHHVALGDGRERRFFQIFIHPQFVKPVEIGETVVHEVLHAMLPAGAGHRKPFSQAAKAVGLEGPPTQTKAGEELVAKIEEWAKQLGDYPHESLDGFGGPKQTTRLIRVKCPDCGYTIRVTYKWLDDAGAPICPTCDRQMEETSVITDGEEIVEQLPLVPVERNIEFRIKAIKKFLGDKTVFDPRWSVFMNAKGRNVHWWVLDYGESTIMRNGQEMSVLGEVTPLRTIAESRADAIALIEALREGVMTYDDIEDRDHQEPQEDWDTDDPRWGERPDAEWPSDDPYLGDEEHEVIDVPEDEADPRFGWEIERGVAIESIDPEIEREKREGWVNERDGS